MAFTLTQAQDELAALTRQILTDRVTTARLREIEATGTRFDADLWAALAGAGVLSAALPESLGGAGLGLLEQCSVLAEIGRAVAPVPYLASVVLGASALAEFGRADQQRQWAEPAGRGEVIIAAALSEEDGDDPARPAATVADLLLIPAMTEAGPAVFIVTPGDPGVTVSAQQVTGGDATATVRLAGALVAADRLLGEPARGAEVAGWLAARATVGLCALQLGVAERALELTAAYAQRRQQFGKPIGAFQAVAQRLADGYIDVEGLRLTLWQAAWRL